MIKFNDVIVPGLQRIREEDAETQKKFLQSIAELRSMPLEALLRIEAVFIPNDEYLSNYCGSLIKLPEYDCYKMDTYCKWNNYLIAPIYDVGDSVVGLGGFNPFLYKEAEENNSNIPYYQYSSAQVFKKGSYLYSPRGVFEKAIKDGYIFVVDGFFDCVSLVDLGFNAAALLGSTVTKEIVVLLRFIKNVIVIADNDSAGLKVKTTLKRYIPSVQEFVQSKTKDIDELLKTDARDKTIAQLRKMSLGDNNVNVCITTKSLQSVNLF